jgi:hypothetical protein
MSVRELEIIKELVDLVELVDQRNGCQWCGGEPWTLVYQDGHTSISVAHKDNCPRVTVLYEAAKLVCQANLEGK